MVNPVIQVCIPNTSRDFFDYQAGHEMPCIGSRVWVPFRNQTRLGVVIGEAQSETANAKIKMITEVIDKTPLLSAAMLALCQWVSRYYQSPLSEVIPLALPKKYRDGEESKLPTTLYYSLAMSVEQAHALLAPRVHRQHALIDCLASQGAPLAKKNILQLGFKSAQLNALFASGILSISEHVDKSILKIGATGTPLTLNEEQMTAVNQITADLSTYQGYLLQGVTGSGKTEVYLQVIAQVLAKGRQVLILVPEIGLTPQLLARFTARFSEPMVVIHSHLNDSERALAWQAASIEEAKIVIGTRAAIFTPMPALGLIIIDEEHDPSLKQMDGVRYSARDTALLRAYTDNIPIILGSATPSLESVHNCALNKYQLLRLRQKALNSPPLHYQILDIRNQMLEHGLATSTLKTIREHLQQNNQVLVFINRRGYAPVLLCHQCGWMADCRACDSHLTLHRSLGKLICHHCGLAQSIPTQCKSCKGREMLPVGAGTQRIHEFLTTEFPTTSIVRVDRDEVRKKKALEEHLARIDTGDAQLIIGTQMLAKGHHFPRLTLVVVLEADNGFYNQDFRALERLGQLLTQVAGRAGREERPGQVIIQTHLPQHPLLNLLVQQGYDAFAQSLLAMRQQAELPPYYYLAVIRAQGKRLPQVLQFMHAVKEQLHLAEISALGPAPAPLARKAENHRLQLLLKSPSRKKLNTTLINLRAWLTQNGLNQNVRWNIDVDPVDLS